MPPEKGTGQRWDFNADTNLVQILATNAAGIPDQIALREKDRGIWQQTTWAEWLELVLSCAAGLRSEERRVGKECRSGGSPEY